MGFGSYDESEQENQQSSADLDENGIRVRENEHDGASTFEAGASNEDLIGKLDQMRADDESDD